MRQIDLVLQKRDLSQLNCELAVKTHAWLMAQVSPECAKSMHTSDELRPFSLFTRVQQSNIALRLSLLHEAAAPILESARSAHVINVSGLDGGIAVFDRIEKPLTSLDQLRKTAPKEFRVILASTASYKHNRKPTNLYSLPPLLYTVAAKLRMFEGVDIPNEEVFELCDIVTYSQYELRSAEYKIGLGITRPGFEGELLLRPGGTADQRDKLALLLRYAAYAGIGAKTALGMGGVLLFEY
jgi:hypothetical protein